jgi:hypothetical protein
MVQTGWRRPAAGSILRRMAGRVAAAVAVLALGLTGVPATASAPDLKPTRIKVKASAGEVVVLQPVRVQGRVSGPRRRVELELRDDYEWRRIDRKKTDGLGRYRFKAPTSWYGKKRLRVVAPATKTHEDAKTRVSVRVAPGYVPLGSKDSWDRISPYKTRYDPCQKVPYAVNPRMLPVDGMAVLNEAIFRVELATGLRYRYVGATRAIPFRTTAGQDTDKDANLVVAWSTPETDAANLAGGVLARGGYLRADDWVRSRRTYKLEKTGILLSASAQYAYRGFENGSALGAVHMHVLGSALGLGNIDDPTQIMDRYARVERPALFGKGDLAGLREHGRDAGCLGEADRTRQDGRIPSRAVIGVSLAR